jgi:hypothetical protein
MFTRDTDQCAIDSIICRKVEAEIGIDGTAKMTVTMSYANAAQGLTFGSGVVNHHPAGGMEGALSQETLDHFRSFIHSAEKDFGRVVFGSGTLDEPSMGRDDQNSAETNRPPRLGLGGRG